MISERGKGSFSVITRFLVLVIGLLVWVDSAHAAPVEMSEAYRERLEAGDRLRFIVRLQEPADVEGDFAARAAIFAEQRARVFERVLGRDMQALAAEVGEDLPRIMRVFESYPGAAMMLNADEIAAFAADPDVLYVMEDELSRPGLSVSVPLIGAATMHSNGDTGVGATVAVLDTGVDIEHPMFAGAMVDSVCFSSTVISQNAVSFCPNGSNVDTTSVDAGDNCETLANNPTTGADGCFHGTHVAGIAMGRTFSGQTGVAPGAGVVGVQVFSKFLDASSCGSDPVPCVRSFTSDQTAALEWLFANRVALDLASVNMSLGGGKATAHCNTASNAPIITSLRAAGVATTISSGNSGFSDGVGSPSCIEAAISVGSTTKGDIRSSFSNSSPLVDLLAPGSFISSAQVTSNDAAATASLRSASGTSMAAPHMAGVFALLRAAHPTATVDEMEAALDVTGVPITDPRNNVTLPRVQVDLADALLSAGGGAGDLDVSPLNSFETDGSIGVPASFGTQVYTLTNSGGSSLNYTVSGDVDWLAFAASAPAGADFAGGPDAPSASIGGTLGAGDSVNITVSIDDDEIVGGGTFLGEITIGVDGGASTTRAARVSVVPPPPGNNDFADAFPMVGLSHDLRYSTTGADKETGEPNHAGNGGGATVWYAWTPRVDGRMRIRTANANYDTMLAVYTGSAVNSLSVVAQNDDIVLGVDTESQLEFDFTGGTTYRIAVDGWGGDAGQADLQFTLLDAPANDDIASAETLSGAAGAVHGDTTNATEEAGEPNHASNPGGASVWYRWTAGADATVTMDTAGALFDTLLEVYSSPDGGATLTSVAENNDVGGGDTSSLLSFAAVNGTEYFIAVDGAGAATGAFQLSWRSDVAANHVLRASVLPNARAVEIGELATGFATLINPARFGAAGANCRIEAPLDFEGAFSYQTTDPATNALTGSADNPVGIASGGSQSFFFSFEPGQTMDNVVLEPVFRCDDVNRASVDVGVNTFNLTASESETADVISVASTLSGDGIATAPLSAATAFSVSAVNIARAGTLTVSADDGGAGLPLTITICETDPGTGACTSARAASVDVDFDTDVAKTFSVFVRGQGSAVAFNPAVNRVFVTFENSGGATVGATSVAVRTEDPT